jgi:hypothetical protein
MPAKAGIQYIRDPMKYRTFSGYWIIRLRG